MQSFLADRNILARLLHTQPMTSDHDGIQSVVVAAPEITLGPLTVDGAADCELRGDCVSGISAVPML